MTSKNLFFNLMKENTKQRLWTVALISLILFFAFPVQTALLISSYLSQERIDMVWEREAQGLDIIKQQLQERFLEWASANNGMMVFLILVFAVVCGISGFSYLHSRKKTDFFHSVPVKREKLFAIVYLNGFLYTAVPYFIFLIISSIMIQVKAGQVFPWFDVIKAYCIHMSFYLLIYSVVVAAVMMTGNTIVSILGTAVFFIWGPGSTLLLTGYYSSYYITFYENTDAFVKLAQRSSPAAWYISAASIPEKTAGMALWALAAAVLLTALCVFLYKKRPSEAAGRAMAFKKSQPVIKLLLVVPIGLLGSLLFKEMMGSDGWSVFGLICGLVISYCTIEIIYNFDFRRLFAHKKQFALCAVCAAAILAFFRFDLSGYDSYVPSEAKMESAGIYCRRMDADFLYDYMVEPEMAGNAGGRYQYVKWNHISPSELLNKMRLTDVAAAAEIGRSGVNDAAETKRKSRGNRSQSRYSYMSSEDGTMVDEVIVAYHLKGGKTVLRSYYMNLSAVRDTLDRVYDSSEYKETVYPVLAYEASDIAGINFQEYSDFSHVSLKNEEIKAQLLETYQKELKGLTSETRRKESPIAAIQFKTVKMQDIINTLKAKGNDYSEFNRKFYYPIYPSFTETISLLKECGINAGEFLTVDNVDKIVMERYITEEDLARAEEEVSEDVVYVKERGSRVATVTDKDKIREILNSSVPGELNCTNYLNKLYSGVRLTAYVSVKQGQTEDEFDASIEPETIHTVSRYNDDSQNELEYRKYSLTFDYDKVPSFVKETFQLTEENMKNDVSEGY